jgi:hypothetical protein
MAINLTDSGLFPVACVHFASVFAKARSSDSFNAEVKDFIAPVSVNIGNCSTTCPTAFDFDFSGGEYADCFRDVQRGGDIDAGTDVSGTGHDALVFTGGAGPAGGTWLTVYDATPGDSDPGPTFGQQTLCADVIFAVYNNVKGAGIVGLLNEGVGKEGLALVLSDAGNTDRLRLATVDGDPDKKGKLTFLPNTNLSQTNVALGAAIKEHVWYRLVMTIDPAATATPKVTGRVFAHQDPDDPNSALGAQIGGTVTYAEAALPAGVTSPGQDAILAQAVSTAVDLSVTNFSNKPGACVPGF